MADNQDIYAVELLYENAPVFEREALVESLRRRSEAFEPAPGLDKPDMVYFLHREHRMTFADGKTLPVAYVVSATGKPAEAERLTQAVQQSWDWAAAPHHAVHQQFTVLVSDMMAQGLDRKTRLNLFTQVVLATMEVAPCSAILWHPSQHLVDPQTYVEVQADERNRLFGAVNVRIFKVEGGAPNETVMDTLGLHVFGLPDVQCRFSGLEASTMAGVLFNTAYILYDQGDVIGDGDTIKTMSIENAWECRHGQALVGPPRMVLEIHPGAGKTNA